MIQPIRCKLRFGDTQGYLIHIYKADRDKRKPGQMSYEIRGIIKPDKGDAFLDTSLTSVKILPEKSKVVFTEPCVKKFETKETE